MQLPINPKPMKKYLLFATLPYAFPILRTLEREIRRRGDRAAWYLEEGCPSLLEPDEERLLTVQEVMDYNPVAVFSPVRYVPDFFPGIKVAVFHGYANRKRFKAVDDHFTIRGCFDIYCSQGPSSTSVFKALEQKHGYFRVYETGWPKADLYFSPEMQSRPHNERPVILYSSTFTEGLTSTPMLVEQVERLVAERDWEWIFMFHPMLDPAISARYEQIAARYANAHYVGNTFEMEPLRQADVMLCDSSSIIIEFMFLDKPVVTFRNSHPGDYLLDIREPEQLESAIEKALTRPEELMQAIHAYTMYHEPHRDGRIAARVVDAVDDFLARGHVGLKRKPLNLVRKLKMRRKMHYPLFKGLF